MRQSKTSMLFTVMLVCFSVTAFVNAQQPFGSLPQPADDQGGQELPGAFPQDGSLPGTPANQIRPGGNRFLPGAADPTQGLADPGPGQTVIVNAKFAGWGGAIAKPDAEEKYVGDQLRGNWIMVNPNGRFTGQVLATENAEVQGMNIFLLNKGRRVKQTVVDEDGQFDFTNVRQGAYSLIGWGPRGFFCFGLNILEHNPESFGSAINHVTPMAFQNSTTINTDWIRYYAKGVTFRVYGRYQSDEGRDDPNQLYGVVGLYNNLPPSRPATSLTSHTVNRTEDGRLVGRVHQVNSINGRPVDVRTTKVLLLENDNVVASTTADNYGVFEFMGVPDGTFGVLAVGNDGVGLIGIRVGDQAMSVDLDGNANASDLIDFTLVSSETIGFLNHYADEAAYKRNLLAPRPKRPDANQWGCPTCNNQPGGCADCQAAYLKSLCRSRGLTFEQWQMHCQGTRSGFGDGYFFRELGTSLRRSIDKVDNFYERTFYPSDGSYNNYNYNNNGTGTNPYGYNGYQVPNQ